MAQGASPLCASATSRGHDVQGLPSGEPQIGQ